jgi:alpha-L-fucosidase
MENNKFGIIIHYGLYSYYGYDNLDNVKRRTIQNGSEWYYGRLICNSTFRPISGSKCTKDYHHNNYNDIDYFSNLDKLINDENKIRNWVKVAKENGASYIILTSKHHDGVCLWNTLTTDRKSDMDICKILSEECKKQDMEFGFYYSWFEFDKPFTLEYFNQYCVKQIDELLQYEPKYMWFDGDWKISQKKIISSVKSIVENLINKDILVNDRIHKNNWNMSSYRVFSDRFIPDNHMGDIKWQHVNTIGYSWGYNKEQKKNHYKSKEEICALYEHIKELGGMFLINLGPDIEGNIISEELDSISTLNK